MALAWARGRRGSRGLEAPRALLVSGEDAIVSFFTRHVVTRLLSSYSCSYERRARYVSLSLVHRMARHVVHAIASDARRFARSGRRLETAGGE